MTRSRANHTISRLLARAVTWLFALLVALAGLAAIVSSFVSFPLAQHEIAKLAHRGQVPDFFTPQFFASLITKVRVAAIALIAASVAIIRLREEIEDALRQVIDDGRSAAAEVVEVLAGLSIGECLTLGFAALSGIALRIWALSEPMRYDESFSFVHYASRPAIIGIAYYDFPNNHLLNSLLMHVSYEMFGSSPAALRLPALLAGIVVLPVSYLLFRLLHGRIAAVLGTSLVAVSVPLIEYSANARGYTTIVAATTVVLACCLYLLRKPNRALMALSTVSAALGMFAVPTMLYALVLIAAWIITEWVLGNSRSGFVQEAAYMAIGAGILTAIAYTPLLAVSGMHSLTSNSIVAPMSRSAWLSALPHMFRDVWAMWNDGWTNIIGVAIGVLALAGSVLNRHGRRVWPLWVGVLAVSVFIAVQRVAPFARVWIFLVPIYLGAAASAMVWLAQKAVGIEGGNKLILAVAALAAAVLAVLVMLQNPILRRNEGKDIESAVATLTPQLKAGDKIVAPLPFNGPLEYYLVRAQVPLSFVADSVPLHGRTLLVAPPDEAAAMLEGSTPGERPQVVANFPEISVFVVKR